MRDPQLAEYIHNTYERIAAQVNWKTQDKCQVSFSELPIENKTVMLLLAKDLNQKFNRNETAMAQLIAKLKNDAVTKAKTIALLKLSLTSTQLNNLHAELLDRRRGTYK